MRTACCSTGCRCRWWRPQFSSHWVWRTGCETSGWRSRRRSCAHRSDALTGVLIAARWWSGWRARAACARARGLPIALLFIDLDHFKEINDSFGHPAGDACLSAVIAPIAAELRQSDIIGRYGGEEFVVILSSANASAAHAIAERIRQRVAEINVEGFGAPDPSHVQHRRCGQRHARRVGPAPDRAGRRGRLRREARGPQLRASGGAARGLTCARSGVTQRRYCLHPGKNVWRDGPVALGAAEESVRAGAPFHAPGTGSCPLPRARIGVGGLTSQACEPCHGEMQIIYAVRRLFLESIGDPMQCQTVRRSRGNA